MTTLQDACVAVINDSSLCAKFPQGMMAQDILEEIHKRYPNRFPLVSVIDVSDTMRELYPELRSRDA